MIKKIIPVLIICLAAGFLASCSSSDPLVSEAETNIKNENYDAALAAAEKSIQQNPQNSLGYYYKGVALGQKAEKQDNPEQSQSLYVQMQEAFNEAEQKAASQESAPDQIGRINDVKFAMWRTEHNRAYELATNDSLMKTTENPLELAVSHLNNATTIQPDSALSWNVLAQVNNMREDYSQAATAQAKYIEKASETEAKDYVLLSQYYRLSQQPSEAVSILEEAKEKFPENTQIVEILADSYSEMGESDKAISTVQKLAEQNPNNPQYRLSYGTQLYQSALKLQSTYDENTDSVFDVQQEMKNAQGAEKQELQTKLQNLQDENTDLKKEIDSLTDLAIVELNATVENRPDEAVAYNTLGIIYQNRAAVLFDERNMPSTDNQRAAELDKEAKVQLEKAMTNYEKAAEIKPDNESYWRSLFQVYTALGMDEKAKEAEKKAGFEE